MTLSNQSSSGHIIYRQRSYNRFASINGDKHPIPLFSSHPHKKWVSPWKSAPFPASMSFSAPIAIPKTTLFDQTQQLTPHSHLKSILVNKPHQVIGPHSSQSIPTTHPSLTIPINTQERRPPHDLLRPCIFNTRWCSQTQQSRSPQTSQGRLRCPSGLAQVFRIR